MTSTREMIGPCQDSLRTLNAEGVKVQAIATSVPYLGQRFYGDDPAEIGQEATLARYTTALLEVFHLCAQVLDTGGLLWVNIGDKANGSGGAGGDWKGEEGGPGKFHDKTYPMASYVDAPGALTRLMLLDGWRLRARIIWDKGREKPEDLRHVRRPRPQHEPILLFQADKGKARYYPSVAPTNGDVWRFPAGGDGPAHLAPFPDELARRCLLASTLPGDTILDPFGGGGTVARVANRMGRNAIHCDLYPMPRVD